MYDEALRALSFQQSTLDNVRSRATLLTAGAALIGSVLGAPALADTRSDAASVLAIAALACGDICDQCLTTVHGRRLSSGRGLRA